MVETKEKTHNTILRAGLMPYLAAILIVGDDAVRYSESSSAHER